jgi:polyisoprenoid-binding protein YceI
MKWIIILILFSTPLAKGQESLYQCSQGAITFVSSAFLERIEAKSENLKGIIDPDAGKFGFSVDIVSFQGFNSPLQRDHFNENYLESHKYPKATFTGKIIESVDFKQPGTKSVRAKGKLIIHGIEQERIIKSTITITDQHFHILSNFTVLLEDYKIRIPRIVNQKIAKEIEVRVDAKLSIN